MAFQDKVGAALLSLAGALPGLLTNDITTPVIGVGVSTVAGAVLGTYAAIGYDDVSHPRPKLFVLASATVILASAATGVIPQWRGWQWVNGGVEAGVAALAALGFYYALPEAIPAVRRLIRGFKLSDLAFFRRNAAPPAAPPEPPVDGDAGK